MWADAFRSTDQRITQALLQRQVLPAAARGFEKASGAIAVRAALQLHDAHRHTLIFAVPEATASTARHVAAALLVGEVGHSKANAGMLPSTELRSLLRGDLLLITQAISESKDKLSQLGIGTGRLSDIWEVATLNRHTEAQASKPRLLLANPGWLAASNPDRRFGAIIIDGSHPRSLEQVADLVTKASLHTPLCILIAPPTELLHTLSERTSASLWFWDPLSQNVANTLVDSMPSSSRPGFADRFLWLCEDDEEADTALANLHTQLVAAARAASGRAYPGLHACWAIHHRLRQIAVPLSQLEQLWAATWSGSLRRRIDELQTVSGHGHAAWDATWPALHGAVKAAYETMLRREETSKFWGLAANLEAFVASPAPHLRVILGTDAEASLLLPSLRTVVPNFERALADNRIEFVTSQREARLVAEGDICPTILLAPRPWSLRYLDVFPSYRVDELLYPFECDIEARRQAGLYEPWTGLERTRLEILRPLGLAPSARARPSGSPPIPEVTVRRSNGHPVALVQNSHVAADIDLELLAALPQGALHESSSTQEAHRSGPEALVNVHFSDGSTLRWNVSDRVDVLFPESESLQRRLAGDLQPGWHVVTFVDGHYDSLYRRLEEAVSARLPALQRISLQLWRSAKENLVRQQKSKKELYQRLVSKGLTSSYGTFISWVSDGNESNEGVLAPQHFEEFKILASEIGTYAGSMAMMDGAFRAIQHERGRHRASGRALHRFLRAVVSGDGYEDALDGVRKLDTAMADVFAAVDVLVVTSVESKRIGDEQA